MTRKSKSRKRKFGSATKENKNIEKCKKTVENILKKLNPNKNRRIKKS